MEMCFIPGIPSDTDAVIDKVFVEEALETLEDIIGNVLSEREQFVIEHRFMIEEPESLGVIGKQIHVTGERVRQIQNKALKKLFNEYVEVCYSRMS